MHPRWLLGVVASLAMAGPALASEPADFAKLKQGYARPADIPFPAANPYSDEKYTLGRSLFFDPRLSAAGNISCGTCHNPSFAWGDGLDTGIGHGATKLGRRTPTVLNLAWSESFFWDGRADTLEQQAVGPIQASVEMNQPMGVLVERLEAIPGYRSLFATAFPGEPVGAETIGKAIATFERTIVSAKAPFDRWIEGDETAIGEQAKRGFVLFNTKANCAVCHAGWRLSDDSFHDIGLKGDDIGRGKYMPEVPLMRRAFKTPGLRNIDQRGPYMHDGSVPTLRATIVHYDTGFIARESLSPEMKRLNLTDSEVDELLAFLLTLTSKDAPVPLPVLPTREAQEAKR
jgi:cytochrome c peroxidase